MEGHWSRGNLVQALHLGGGGAVDEEAEDVVDDDGIVDPLRFDVGLAHEDQRRALLGVEEALHAGHGGGLVPGHVPAVQVAGGKDLQDAGEDAGDDAELEEDAAVALRRAVAGRRARRPRP